MWRGRQEGRRLWGERPLGRETSQPALPCSRPPTRWAAAMAGGPKPLAFIENAAGLQLTLAAAVGSGPSVGARGGKRGSRGVGPLITFLKPTHPPAHIFRLGIVHSLQCILFKLPLHRSVCIRHAATCTSGPRSKSRSTMEVSNPNFPRTSKGTGDGRDAVSSSTTMLGMRVASSLRKARPSA